MSIDALRGAIREAKPTVKAAQLRELLPDIEARLAEGVTFSGIQRALAGAGLAMTVQTLQTYVYRLRRERDDAGRALDPPRPRPQAAQDFTASRVDMTQAADHASLASAPKTLLPASLPESRAATVARRPDSFRAQVERDTDGTPLVTAPLETEESESPSGGSGRPLSVHEQIAAARARVAGVDYSKFLRKPLSKASK